MPEYKNEVTEAVVLCGGLGTRLRPAVPSVPKPMAPVGGLPFLTHLLSYWHQQGIGHFVLSTGYKKEAFRLHYGDSFKGARLSFAEELEPLGTGGALLHSLPFLHRQTPFLLLNGDTYFGVSLATLWAQHLKQKASVTLALRSVTEGSRYTTVKVNRVGNVTALASGVSGAALIHGGVCLVDPAYLAGHKQGRASFEQKLLVETVQQGRCASATFDTPFIDIGIPEDYAKATEILGVT